MKSKELDNIGVAEGACDAAFLHELLRHFSVLDSGISRRSVVDLFRCALGPGHLELSLHFPIQDLSTSYR